MNINNIPDELKKRGRFCCWRYESRDGRKTKVPYDPLTGRRAETNRPGTFRDLDTAIAAVAKYDGIGILVGNYICAIDLDDCFEKNGILKPYAQDMADMFSGCYMERSPSGKGLRIISMATGYIYDKAKYYINNRPLGLEVYVAGATNRFVTITGDVYRAGDILEKADVLQVMLDKYMQRRVYTQKSENLTEARSYLSDESVIEKASSSASGEKFKALRNGDTSGYGSQSEADMALCSMLAFWCGRDVEQMDRLFRESGLMREKWDRPQSGSTYGQITLEKAANMTKEMYSPVMVRANAADDFSEVAKKLGDMKPESNPRYTWSDIGNGYLFADTFKDIARYVPERKLWYIYNGKAWRPDTGNLRTMELCKELADRLMLHALSITDERVRTAYIAFVKKWQIRKNRETVLKDATSVYPISMTQFDNDPYLFNCQNGTFNIRTGEFYDHRPEDMLSKLAGVKYEPDANCERWDQFIREVMSTDMDKALFLQKALGYSLTGNTQYEAMFILYGATSRNGKSTVMETFLKIMGDYGKTARPETIGMKMNNSSNNPTEDIARLAGARFCNISEPDKKLVLSTALVKTLTGNDSINARFLHENSFDYRPQFKLFINTNHLPQVNDLTLFASGRVKIIPFERHFEEHEQDKKLKSVLAKPKNLSGILNWCIEGYRKLVEEGFDIPESVHMATEAYHHSSDKIGLFIEDVLIKDDRGEERTSEVYGAYKQWCVDNGFYAESIRNFKAMIGAVINIERKRPRAGGGATTMVTGYKLSTGFDDVAVL